MPSADFLLRAGRIVWSGIQRGIGGWRRGVRCGGHRLGSRGIGDRRHGAFWIQQVVFAGAQSQLDERSRVGDGFALPSIVGLIAAHGFFAGLVPGSGGFAAEIVRADQGFLNSLGAFRVYFLLSPGAHRLFSRGTFSRGCGVRPAGLCRAGFGRGRSG